MSKGKVPAKTEEKTKREQRDDNYDEANMAIRAAVIEAYQKHGLMPIEMFSLLSGVLSDLMSQELERQYEELDED